MFIPPEYGIGEAAPAAAAANSAAATLTSFLNPASVVAGVLGPALGGAPSSASGSADSGSPLQFGAINFGSGSIDTDQDATDTSSHTSVPVQPTVGVTQTPLGPQLLPTGVSVPQGSGGGVDPAVLIAGAGLAGLAALVFLI